MGNIKKYKPREFEAAQVPYWNKQTTAAKDVEELYRKLMSWLDEHNAYDIWFDPKDGAGFRHYNGYTHRDYDVEPGQWIKYVPEEGFKIISDDKFRAKYEEV